MNREEKVGPLRWVRGLVREDPGEVESQVAALLGDGPARLVIVEGIATSFLDSVVGRTDANRSDHATVYAGAQFLDSVASARELLRLGHVRGALFHLRAMIEGFAVLECFHNDETLSQEWIEAKAPRERLKFSFEAVYRRAKRGELWKGLWETFKDKTHSNYGAFPVQSRLRPVFGGDTWIGPFYDPPTIARAFLIVFALAWWFADQLSDWYEADGILPDSTEEWNAVGGYSQFADSLNQRADTEIKEISLRTGSVSIEEQETALQIFERLKAQRGNQA